MTRTLKDYRPQHDEDCNHWRCAQCGKTRFNPWHRRDLCQCDGYSLKAIPELCTCGLAALLVTDEKDQSRSDQPQPGRCDADPRGDDRGGSMTPRQALDYLDGQISYWKNAGHAQMVPDVISWLKALEFARNEIDFGYRLTPTPRCECPSYANAKGPYPSGFCPDCGKWYPGIDRATAIARGHIQEAK